MGHFLNLVIMMSLGLGAMYMMHLLAQDYNRIRQPIVAARALAAASGNLLNRNKRATNENQHLLRNHWYPRQPHITSTVSIENSTTIDWKRILSRDPFECLLSLICQIMAGAENESKEAIQFMDFLEYNRLVAPAKIGKAFSRGLTLHGESERCFEEYPFCVYSAKTMLRILNWMSDKGLAS